MKQPLLILIDPARVKLTDLFGKFPDLKGTPIIRWMQCRWQDDTIPPILFLDIVPDVDLDKLKEILTDVEPLDLDNWINKAGYRESEV